MKKENRKNLTIAAGLLGAFAAWTMLIRVLDVQPIGPQGSSVGFAEINRFVHRCTGVHMGLYRLTDWLSIVPLCFVAGFGCLGLAQWIRRRQLRNVDRNLLVLGGFYVLVLAVYGFFEWIEINYRPVLIDGVLEASYPSSTTMLVLCVMPTAMLQLKARIQNRTLRRCMQCLLSVFTLFMVIGRLLSGVHWVTDILGGILLSAGLVMLYHTASCPQSDKQTVL